MLKKITSNLKSKKFVIIVILTMNTFLSVINDKEVREEYILNGEKSANLFLEYN